MGVGAGFGSGLELGGSGAVCSWCSERGKGYIRPKKFSPALYTSMSKLSESFSRTGSGASSVSGILEWWAYSEITNAFIAN